MLRAKHYGDNNILHEVPRGLWAFPADYATRKAIFKRNFTVSFPTRAEWKADDYDASLGPKMVLGVNAHRIGELYCPPGVASVLLGRDSSSKGNIVILTDSQTNIKALSGNILYPSGAVQRC